MNYCESLTTYQRRKTHEVYIGNIPLGGDHPIRIQSMTSTSTADTGKTVEQCIRIIEAGGEYVRITIPTIKDAGHLAEIKKQLHARGYNYPLIADVHFNPKVAEQVTGIADKVRINPGNYVSAKKFNKFDYSDEEFQAELNKIKVNFLPLLEKCRATQTALRIGVNHGSLSDRIMSRHGDTPEGMAESAMEFLRICKNENFTDVVVSLKASNTQVLVKTNRLLAAKMNNESMTFPLHLGVTEAGEGEDGRIKSAVGIGALLTDGLGDTIRVSLTEDPEKEIPVARELVKYFTGKAGHAAIPPVTKNPIGPYGYRIRQTFQAGIIGSDHVPVVVTGLSSSSGSNYPDLQQAGWNYRDGRWKFTDQAADIIYLKNIPPHTDIPENKLILTDYAIREKINEPAKQIIPLLTTDEYKQVYKKLTGLKFLRLTLPELQGNLISIIKDDPLLALVIDPLTKNSLAEQRRFVIELMNTGCRCPVVFRCNYTEKTAELLRLKSAADLGALFLDGTGNGIWITNSLPDITPDIINHTAFGILQAARVRTTKTEYISCPSCGRTLFDLQKTTAMIRAKTHHLKGLKIGIMGCIVNGIGEMADADYGYVGAGPGKVSLYKSRRLIKRNIPEDQAVDELVNVIKASGDWQEPENQ